jgi:hypothetical protein
MWQFTIFIHLFLSAPRKIFTSPGAENAGIALKTNKDPSVPHLLVHHTHFSFPERSITNVVGEEWRHMT